MKVWQLVIMAVAIVTLLALILNKSASASDPVALYGQEAVDAASLYGGLPSLYMPTNMAVKSGRWVYTR